MKSKSLKPEKRRLFRELFQHRDLLMMLTSRDIKIRYKQSVMGFLWAILMPVLVVGSGLIVMIALSSTSGHPIQKEAILSVAVKSVSWAFFVAAVKFATNSLIMNKELVTKIYFPREVLPLASVLASCVDFGVALAVLVIILSVMKIGLSIYLLWVPVLLLLLALITTGFALLLSCANLFFRDVKYLVEILLTYGIFFTPVFYSARSLGKLGTLMMVNPVGPILEGLNSVVILHQPPGLAWLGNSAAWAVFGSILFWKIFAKAESSFAESI
jgi:homopolymeric O-antigen transport system permease protein